MTKKEIKKQKDDHIKEVLTIKAPAIVIAVINEKLYEYPDADLKKLFNHALSIKNSHSKAVDEFMKGI